MKIPSPKSFVYLHVILFALPISQATSTSATLAPFCCDLSYRCIVGLQNETGDWRIGTNLTARNRKECIKPKDQDTWCIAKWTDDAYYCTSAGNFMKYIEGYRPKCKRRFWPRIDVSPSPCPVAESTLPPVDNPKPAPNCCDLSGMCAYGLNGTSGEYEIGNRATINQRVLCNINSRTRCVAKYSDRKWWCTEPSDFIRHIKDYRGFCRGRFFPSTTEVKEECPVDEEKLQPFVPHKPAQKCCLLSERCLNGLRNSTGDFRLGNRLSKIKSLECTEDGRDDWCAAKWTDGTWWCTSAGFFLKHLNGYVKNCPRKKFPTAAPKECPVHEETLPMIERASSHR